MTLAPARCAVGQAQGAGPAASQCCGLGPPRHPRNARTLRSGRPALSTRTTTVRPPWATVAPTWRSSVASFPSAGSVKRPTRTDRNCAGWACVLRRCTPVPWLGWPIQGWPRVHVRGRGACEAGPDGGAVPCVRAAWGCARGWVGGGAAHGGVRRGAPMQRCAGKGGASGLRGAPQTAGRAHTGRSAAAAPPPPCRPTRSC
jgi:hypothetical protein